MQQAITIKLLMTLLDRNHRGTVADTKAKILNVKKMFMEDINKVKRGQASIASQETSDAAVQTILPQSIVVPSSMSCHPPFSPLFIFNFTFFCLVFFTKLDLVFLI